MPITPITPVRLELKYKEMLARIIKRYQCANESDAIRLALQKLDEVERKEEEKQSKG